jgi:hypothetical protein
MYLEHRQKTVDTNLYESYDIMYPRLNWLYDFSKLHKCNKDHITKLQI